MRCFNQQLRKFQNYILYVRNEHSLQLKQISLIGISTIYLCIKKQKQSNHSLAAILDAILYQGSLLNRSQITRSNFEPFYALNNLNLMQ